MSSMQRSSALNLSTPVNEEQDHVLGPADAPITLVEYGDFECPFCGRSYPAVRRMRGELRALLRFFSGHFPRPKLQNALHAANTSKAASAQPRLVENTTN